MVNRASIMAWNEHAPWIEPAMVEQDLIICRALVDIFSDEFLREQLAFRGGTALHKLYMHPQPRYSEDIDLVQINPGPIKPILYRLGEVLSWMPDRVTKVKRYNNTILFRMESEIPPVQPIRLKVEINCKEHFSVYPMVRVPFVVNSLWFKGACEVLTYELAELTGTKLRAVYQRRKGRDLFDLWKILSMQPELDKVKVMESYERSLGFTASHLPTYKEFLLNMDGKLQDDEFLTDTEMILGPQVEYDPQVAWEKVKAELVERLNPEV